MRAVLRPFLNIVIVAGLILALWPLGQTAYGLWNQRQLAAQFQSQNQGRKTGSTTVRAKAQTAPAARSSSGRTQSSVPVLASQQKSQKMKARAKPRWPLTKLTIADIGLETFVVQGMDDASLRRGPGHDINSSLPGEGNCVIAGHRNVYGSFFYRLDELLPGAPIVLENRDGKFNYVVDSVFVTPDTNLTVLKKPPPGAPPLLTLITCTIPHTNNRIILQASLSESLPTS